MQSRPELLAPVGSWDALIAAVQNGADAVYLGGKMFSARQNADNFDRDELLQAVDYAHIRGVRVLVTVNTLVADQELSQLSDYLRYLYEIGVDAAIIQDLGVARLARRILPGLTLHASTQMTVHNAAGVRQMQDLGMQRIVLSRELSLKDIIAIKQATGAELEVFVHGALCICYSGQCLMSSLIGGRSGNRGRCAQPCRLNYALVDEKGEPLAAPDKIGSHLLSPRDLNLIRHLPDIIAAGVDSLKIEGRMKRPEYVATVVRIYRRVLDRALAGQQDSLSGQPGAAAEESAIVTAEEEKQLTQIFNRDFTTAYFYSRPGRDMMSYKRPNNRGLKLGRVGPFVREKGMIEIQLEDVLRLGDGIEIWVTEGGRKGIEVGKIILNGQPVEEAGPGSRVLVSMEGRVKTGDRVFKTHDVALIREARQTYTSTQETKKIPLYFRVTAEIGGHLQITVRDEAHREVSAAGTFVLEKAEKKPLTEDTLLSQLNRLGNTPFAVDVLEAHIEPGVMVPLSEINEVRRRVITRMEEQRVIEKRPQPLVEAEFSKSVKIVLQESDTPEQQSAAGRLLLTAAVGSLEALKQAAQKGADIVYYGGDVFVTGLSAAGTGKTSGRLHGPAEEVQRAIEFCRRHHTTLVVRTPRIMQEKDLPPVLEMLELAKNNSLGVLAGNPGILKIAGEMGIEQVYADFTLNVYNSQALLWLKEQGLVQVALSPELTLEQIKVIASGSLLPVETLVHGAVPMMVSEHCITGSVLGGAGEKQSCSGPCTEHRSGLRDRMDITFPLRTDRYCRTHLYNARELCLLEYIKPLSQAGINALRVELEINDADYTALVVSSYRAELDKYLNRSEDYRPPSENHSLLKAMGGVFTKGHYYRGVL